MKKAIFLGILVTLAVPITSLAAFDANLKYGSSGSSVIELQEFLTSQGAYSGPISGNFYSLTLAGVKAYQAKQNISPVSGYWGPLSRTSAQATLALSNSDSDEKTETGSVISPVVQATTQVYTSVMNTPVIVAPTCSITAKYINSTNGASNQIEISWISENAVEGTVKADWYGNGKPNALLTIAKTEVPTSSGNTVEKGTQSGWLSPVGNDNPITLYGYFYGKEGKTNMTICQTTLNPAS